MKMTAIKEMPKESSRALFNLKRHGEIDLRTVVGCQKKVAVPLFQTFRDNIEIKNELKKGIKNFR